MKRLKVSQVDGFRHGTRWHITCPDHGLVAQRFTWRGAMRAAWLHLSIPAHQERTS